MTNQEKEAKIKKHVEDMLKYSYEAMLKRIDDVLASGAVDVQAWDEKYAPMLLPKTIVSALLQRETVQYMGKGTDYEKRIKGDVKNILYFI